MNDSTTAATLLEHLDAPAALRPGSLSSERLHLAWSADGIEVTPPGAEAPVVFGEGDVRAVQLSWSDRPAPQSWLERLLRRRPHQEPWWHVELRTTRGLRLSLSARAPSNRWVEGLPMLDEEGDSCETSILLALIDTARSLGAKIARDAPKRPSPGVALPEVIDLSGLRFQNGRAPFKRAGLWGFLEESGEVAIEARFKDVNGFTGDVAAVRVGEHWGYVGIHGEEVAAAEYTMTMPVKNGVAEVDGLPCSIVCFREPDTGEIAYHFSDATGALIKRTPLLREKDGRTLGIPRSIWLEDAYPGITEDSKDGLNAAWRALGARLEPFNIDKRWGYQMGGTVRISAVYEDVSPFSEGVAAVCLEGRWGFINPMGRVVVPIVFEHASNFEGGAANVWSEGTKLRGDLTTLQRHAADLIISS